MQALDELGGLKDLGGPLTDNMYHASWVWAGSTPFRSTKLVAKSRGCLELAGHSRASNESTPRFAGKQIHQRW